MIALKLFRADGTTADPEVPVVRQKCWSLRTAYENTHRRDQEAKGIAQSTIKDYRTTLKKWEAWLSESGLLDQIQNVTEELLDQFADHLGASGHLGRTINKHIGYIETILKRCGPKGPHNKRGRRILSEFVFCERRDETDSLDEAKVVPQAEFEKIYSACRVARRPAGRTPAPLVWRTVSLMLWTYGMRRNDLFLMPEDAVRFDPRCPIPEVKIEHQWGWLHFTIAKTKRRKRQPLTLPLTAGLHAHLKQIQGRDGRLFPFAKCQRDWYAEWERIQFAAGLEDTYTFKDMRKTSNVEWDSLPGEATLGEHVLGHSARDVNSRHYKALVRKLVGLIDSYPLSGLAPV